MKLLLRLGYWCARLQRAAAPATATSLSFEFMSTTAPARARGVPDGTIDLSQFATGDVLVDVTLDPDVIGYVATGFPGRCVRISSDPLIRRLR